ncbi:two-component regulator propeller domain-containing protein [Joostella sp.]|uniref:hybrid sensor histidine kinase/response regulator transcription factor n=1 Tax=Joostella sp. TaxID=2231138 RepID=UPI003A8EF8DE
MHNLVYLFVFFISWTIVGQRDTYKFNKISTSDGLSHNSVIAITQDQLGQIWIGTRDGLNKYNGTDFTIYRHDKNDSTSLSNNDVLCLEEDKEGFIWVGTNIGLNKYNPRTNTFKTYFSGNSKTSISHNAIRTISEFSNDEIWIGTASGISIYDKETKTFKSILKGINVFSIEQIDSNVVAVGTNNGLLLIQKASDDSYKTKAIQKTSNFFVQDLIKHDSRTLLLATRENHVLEYDIINDDVKPYFKEEVLKGKNKNIRKLLFDSKGKLWLGSYNGLQIADESNGLVSLGNDINDDESLSDNFIKSLFKDRNGSIWIGTYLGGINIWDKSNINFVKITQRPGNSSLSFKSVSSIVEYQNHIFFGTEGGGISILDTITNSYKYIRNKKFPALPTDNIKALFCSDDNNLWIGTFNRGLAIFDLKKEKFITEILPKEVALFIKDVGISSISQKDDLIYIGTLGKGLLKFNVKDRSYDIISVDTDKGKLVHNIVKAVNIDSKDNLWVGTYNGLSILDSEGNSKQYFYDEDLKIGYGITCIFEDAKGIIWVGTEVDGLFKLVGNDFKSIDLQLDNGENVIGIRSIVQSHSDKLWISTTNQGIIDFDVTNEYVIKSYGREHGLISNQFNNNASLIGLNSTIYFGGAAGVISFNPKKLLKNDYSPQVILTDFKIKNESVSVNHDKSLLTKTIAFTNDIELSYKQGNFNISFSIPNYINSDSNHYIYRLKGLENDWIETSNSSVSYTIQQPGSYVFEVKGINNDGVINNESTKLKISVRPAPWRTWWAFLLYGIIIFSILYYLLNILKSKQKLSNQLILEKIESEQTKNNNKSKLEFFTNISHEFRTPLTLILGPLSQILENYRGTSEMYKRLKVIESNSNHLLQLINRLMDFRKLENDLVKLETAEGNIVKFLKEIFLSFSEYAKDGNYQYEFYSPSESILVYYDRYKLERVIYNLISNAFRYTPKNGKIILRVLKEDNHIIIQVEDSGVGIAEKYRDKIFERFFELSVNKKPDNDYNKGTGIGLSIVKNIIDLHKGAINVEDNINGQGTIFKVKLLLGRTHLRDTDIIENFKFSDDIEQYITQLNTSEEVIEEDIFENLNTEEKPIVLLVEDNKPLRKFMRSLLKNEYQVLEAENGDVAFKVALREQVNLIISDVIMPIMTGTELCSKIKEDIRTSHIPLILLTSRSSLIYKIEGLESGADDYISKPFNIKEFKLRIKNILNSISRLKQKMDANEVLQADDLVLTSIDESLYKKALQIVEKNITNEQFDIPLFCEELGVSRTVLFKKIKAWTNYTPKDFIQHIRLKKAADLLEQDQFTISQISYSVGFKNPKYFSKCFRKKFGMTPTDYIKTFNV